MRTSAMAVVALLLALSCDSTHARALSAATRSLKADCTHTIASGDTFWGIAQQLGTDVPTLESLNPGVDPVLLQIGQNINVPCADVGGGGSTPVAPSPPADSGANCPVCTIETVEGSEGAEAVCSCVNGVGNCLDWQYVQNKGEDWGCYNGYCWAKCVATTFGVFGKEWCYTTRGSSQDYNYITCNTDDDCCAYWSCAGSCTV